MSKKKAFIQTYGCQMNEHDTYRMMGVLAAEGYQMVTEPDEAQLVILNTCSVRHNPENKVYSFLGAIRPRKKLDPSLVIAVAGCVAQQEGERILAREKAVDIVFGPDNLFHLPEMLERVKQGERVLMTKWQPNDRRVQNFIPDEWVEKGHVEGCKAYVSITKGCDNFCTFCVVPFTRGREVSREPESILREVRDLVKKGAKEIWLLGQNVNSYRVDAYGFYDLLDEVSRVPGLRRLRFTSPHPNDWNDSLSDLMAERETICNYLHLPFQSGSDRILEAMRRGHTMKGYLEKVGYMKAKNPQLELSTDLIVGFPSETEEDFEKTLEAIQRVRFSQLYSFKYSPRPKTRALKLEDDVPREVKEERLARVIALQAEIHDTDIRRYVNTTQHVLIDGAHPRKRHMMSGRTDGYRPVSIEDSALEIGDEVTTHITHAQGHWLYGMSDSAMTAPL